MHNFTFTLGEMGAILGGFVSLGILIFGFFIRRTVYQEIDDLKENKQEKPFCPQQKALCGQEMGTMCNDIKEMKINVKEDRNETYKLNLKMERVMTKMKIKYDDLNGG